MFGYVRAHKSELLVKEYDQYKAIYCQLCRELGDSFGIGSRYILSYDITFYVLLALSVSGADVTAANKRCTVNPAKRCMYLESADGEYIKGAALSIIMTYHKLRDNIQDEGFFKSIACRIGCGFFKGKYKKATSLYPDIAQIVEEYMVNQGEAEKSEDYSIDSCSEPTAIMLSRLCENLSHDKMQAAVLKEFGYYFGRWIYIMDAADDLRDDLKNGSFNPFIKFLSLEEYHRIKPQKKSAKEFTDEDRNKAHEQANEVLNSTISMMLGPLNLLDLEYFGPIIENIILKGLPEMQREILFLHIKDKKSRNKRDDL